MSQELNLSILSQQTASYTTTVAWVNVPQHIITVTEDGDYNIKDWSLRNNNTDGDGTGVRLAVNGNPMGVAAYGDITGAVGYNSAVCCIDNVALKVADVVSLQAIYAGSATEVPYVAAYQMGLQITKVGV